MYPLKFYKVLKEKVWGGREFGQFLGVPLEPGKTLGESWEVSAHPNGPSVVANGPWAGRTLPELLATEGARLVGKALFAKYGTTFPLLIKYLDIHDKLSIQVHPDNEYALAHEDEFGKSECWYVLNASRDAQLILGMAPGITKESFAQRSAAGQWEGLFREINVATGDFIHVIPGTVHASLRGSVLICEVQQNSDTTYRIYDFDRLENGKLRPLHLAQALDVIRFEEKPRLSRAGTRPRKTEGDVVIEPLVSDPQYVVVRFELKGTHRPSPVDQFQVVSVLQGGGALLHNERAWLVQEGETWLLPAGLDVVLQGEFDYLLSTVPE